MLMPNEEWFARRRLPCPYCGSRRAVEEPYLLLARLMMWLCSWDGPIWERAWWCNDCRKHFTRSTVVGIRKESVNVRWKDL